MELFVDYHIEIEFNGYLAQGYISYSHSCSTT